MDEQRVSGFPVTVDGGGHSRVVGILTRRDMKFRDATDGPVSDLMTTEPLVTAPATGLPSMATATEAQ